MYLIRILTRSDQTSPEAVACLRPKRGVSFGFDEVRDMAAYRPRVRVLIWMARCGVSIDHSFRFRRYRTDGTARA